MKKLLICVVASALLCLGATFSFAASIKEVVDSECYNQVLANVDISTSDVKAYKKVFELIREGEFKKADKTAAGIENKVLMGHVLAEKYVSDKYQSKFSELKEWIENYSDLPQCRQIYAMAIKKKGKKDEMPVVASLQSGQRFYSPYSWFNEDYEVTQPKNGKYLRKNVNEFRKLINKGQTKKARAILEDKMFRQKMPNRNYDAMSATLALVYLLDNENALSVKWASKASTRSLDATASWAGGLASWKLKKYKDAATYFERLGSLTDNDEWLTAAGAYWAYRSNDKLKNENEAKKWLKVASKYSRTFYGVLANHKLGKEINYNWADTAYFNDFNQYDYIDELLTSPAMRRAVILINAKNPGLAEKELKHNYRNMSPKQQEVALYITKQYKMHYLGIEISNCLRTSEKNYDAIAYPNPKWKPKNGWKVDKALVWALVRQESAFHPGARSGAGAMGLMQLMPNTAYHILKTRNNDALSEIGHNLDTGQQYVNYLLAKPFIEGNLFFMMTAYNAGPGNLVKWQKKMSYGDDPLMFIETVPARETRLYIKRVTTNYWIYNMRFDKENKSLEAVAKGKWPVN